MNERYPDASTFQEHMVELTRAFGWHRPGSTPCGKAVPIAEAHALLELSRSEGISQVALGGALKLKKSTVSRLATNLEQRGWIVRRPSESDGRVLELSLTAAGCEAARDLAAAREAKMAAVLERIPTSDRALVVRSLRTLIEAIHGTDT